ncbi:MAG: molybdenum cofactor guanylyltransferase MobA [Pseudomonadota bacterium]
MGLGRMTPLGVVLAGGLARRMGGGDKCLLPMGDGVLLDQVLLRLAPQVAGIALNANGDPDRFGRFGLPVIPDTVAGFAGPLAGVLAGLDWAAKEGTTQIVTVAGDTPFFPTDLAAQLTAAASPVGLALAGTPDGQRHPTFGLWPVALRDALREALAGGTRKVVAWTDPLGCGTALFEGPDPFFNVNTPEDLAAAQAIA